MSNEPDDPKPTNSDPTQTPTPEPTPTDPPADPSLIGGEPKPAEPAFGLEPVEADAFKSLLPEGFEPDEALSTRFLEALNTADSREALAKSMIEIQSDMLKQADEAAAQAWSDTQDAWKDEVRADKEFGGDNLDRSLATARTLIETYAKDQAEATALKDFFALTGVGNSIHMVRLLNRLAAAVPGEAKPVEGTPSPTEKSRADKLFGATQ